GLAFGVFLRPHVVGTLKLFYIQIVELFWIKQSGIPLLFGKELSPLHLVAFWKSATAFFLVWFLSMIIFVYHELRRRTSKFENQNILLWTSAFLSFAFCLMTIFVARRSMIFWVLFGVVFVAVFFGRLIETRRQKDVIWGAMFLLFLFIASFTIRQNTLNMKQYAVPPGWLYESAQWLEEHTPKNSIVFNTHWDNFSHLFFFNQHNYYIGGMDPIFQYSYDPRLYWEYHYLSSDQMGNVSCASYPCRDEDRRDTYEILRNDFGVSYVFVEKDRNPRFYDYLSSDVRFKNVFETSREIVFAVQP
ncbi:MAG TPA: hypothetical protein VJH89_03915, partial [Patescibacteria group bacterium]|nr:hypothetical protein [Patescibacteria group bacterium]